MIELRDVTKRYNGDVVLRGLNQSISPGEILVLFGPNGSGKTTLINLIATLLTPTRGSIVVNGLDATSQSTKIKQLTGLVTHDHFLYRNLTGLENLRYYSSLYHVSDSEARIRELAHQLGITEYLQVQVRTLSNGTQKRFSIARALLHNPSILLLDEPETGLDAEALRQMQSILSQHRENGGTAVVATHHVEWGIGVGNRIAIINYGKIVYDKHGTNLQPNLFKEDYVRVTGTST